MSDLIKQFVDFMRSVDCAPASPDWIIADDKRHYYQIEGDKRGVKKGVYCLLEDEHGAVGWCKNYREGVSHGWSSKVKREWSAEEKAAWKQAIADKKAANEAESAKLRQEAVVRSQEIMKAAKPATSHPYLTRKGIKPTGFYEARNFKLSPDMVQIDHGLIIPAYKNGKLSTLQAIDADGGKWFMPDGEIDGAYGVIKGTDMDVLFIVEGAATGASVFEATGRTVVIAFNAGNLKPVTKAMRDKYPQAQIVIAADNDAWRFKYPRPTTVKAIERDKVDGDDARWEEWFTAGYLENKGILEARQAAVAIGGASVIFPEFGWHKDKPTDWNDAHKIFGLDEIRIRLEAISVDRAVGVPVPQLDDVVIDSDSPPSFTDDDWEYYLNHSPSIEAYEDDVRAEVGLYGSDNNDNDYDKNWKEKLHYDDKGNLTSKSLNNVSLMLANAPAFKDMFCYDEFAHEKIIVQCPPWETPEKFKPRPITDEDLTWLCVGLEKIGLTLNMMVVKKILDAVIMKKRRNPAREYFNSLKWDGVKRLDKWLAYYAGAESDDADYLAAIGTIWMVAAVTRVFHCGHKFDHMLILEGEQGAGKSSLLRELATIYGKEYFDDTIKANELGQTAIVPKLQGVLIIEIAELAGLRKADIETFKQQITIQDDRIVKKYSNEPTRYPRQFVLAGTFNLVQGYLDDPTGNRRFWPCKVGKIDLEALRNDKAQLWAEAVVLYRQGLPLYLDDTMKEKLLITQESRKIVHPWLPDLESISRDRQFVSSKEIWEALAIERAKRTVFASNDIAKIMVELGYEYGRAQIGGVRQYGWSKKA
ncbi:virulence associated protein E [Caudoviricetes sp.]|nr:virulence associated protein E [Caudoviricetes sp.]